MMEQKSTASFTVVHIVGDDNKEMDRIAEYIEESDGLAKLLSVVRISPFPDATNSPDWIAPQQTFDKWNKLATLDQLRKEMKEQLEADLGHYIKQKIAKSRAKGEEGLVIIGPALWILKSPRFNELAEVQVDVLTMVRQQIDATIHVVGLYSDTSSERRTWTDVKNAYLLDIIHVSNPERKTFFANLYDSEKFKVGWLSMRLIYERDPNYLHLPIKNNKFLFDILQWILATSRRNTTTRQEPDVETSTCCGWFSLDASLDA